MDWIFNANAAPGDPTGYTAQQQRQKIALAMMSQRKGYPKTVGEGLTSIGDSINDVMQMKSLERSLAAQSATDKAAIDKAYPQTGNRADAGTDTLVAALDPKDEETATPPAQPPPPLVPPPPSNLASVPMPRQAMQVNAATPTFPTSPGFPASTAPRLDPTVQVASDPNYTPAPSTGPTTRGEAAPWLRGSAETNDLYKPAPAVAQGATNDVQANQLAMLNGQPQQPSSYAPTASLQTGSVSDAPPITGARDAITNTLMQRQAPPTGVFPPPDQPTPPINLAALQSPPEAAGNRPIVMPDVQPQPQVMAQAQPQTAPQTAPQPYEMPEPVAPVPPVKDPTLTPLQRKWMPTLLGDTSPVQKGIAKSIIDQEQAKKDAAYENEVKNYELKKSIYPSAVEAKRNWEAQRREREQKLRLEGQKVIPGAPTNVPPGAAPRDPRLGTDASPQRDRIPEVPPPPPGVSAEEWQKQQAPLVAKSLETAEKAKPQFEQMIQTIRDVRNHPGKAWGTGMTSGIAPWGSDAYDFGTRVAQLKGKNFLNAYQYLRGAGNIANIEGEKAEQAQSAIDVHGSEKNMNNALLQLENQVRTDYETLQRKHHLPVTAWQLTPNDLPAPDINQIGRDKKTGKLQQYIGGNPTEESSYRDVK
jgi:hypothetical protein